MQLSSLLASVTAILLAMTDAMDFARWAFVVGLVLLLGSLAMALQEITISLDALDLELGSAP